MTVSDADLMALARSIVSNDAVSTSRLLSISPSLAWARVRHGATREAAKEFYLQEIEHYIYSGDTALHIAAAAYRADLVSSLVAMGAEVAAKNRRGAEPLHYAVDGGPGSRTWDPHAQAQTVTRLIQAGADPNGTDQGGATPLHRAVRGRCAAAVEALLEGGADPQQTNRSGSTPVRLATMTTGRGGSGSPEAKEQQEVILQLLDRALRAP